MSGFDKRFVSTLSRDLKSCQGALAAQMHGLSMVGSATVLPLHQHRFLPCRPMRPSLFRRLRVQVARAFRAFSRFADLALENLALRQQLASLKRQVGTARPSPGDRLFWCALRRLWPRWRDALQLVRPQTVVRWHRLGFRVFWRWRSRRRGGRPSIPPEVRELIETMAAGNPTWGAPRIHGELLRLGIDLAQSTVARCMPPRPRADPSPTWKSFVKLHLHESVGIDFFAIPTATFEVLIGFLVVDHGRRKLRHVAVTRHPTAEWTARQLVEAFPFDTAPRFVFRDRDAIYGARFVETAKNLGVGQVISAPHSPWQSPYAERMIGSIRRELIDHVIVRDELHATRLLREYQAYYNASRTHLSLDKDAPDGRAVLEASCGAKVVALPVLGGLHHRYERRAA